MATVQDLAKEVEQLKKQQRELERRLKSVEEAKGQKPGPAEAEAPTKQEQPTHSGTSTMGIVLIVIGALLSLSIIGLIIGIPLIIWGIIHINKRKNEAEKQSAPAGSETPETTKAEPNGFEENLGMKWLGRIGMLALVLGIAYFIKYAIDNDWIGLVLRIALGLLLGAGLILTGNLLARKEYLRIWAEILSGGGFALTYFILYASYYFEEYRAATHFNEGLTIALMILVTCIAVAMSLRNKSRIMASEGFLLGYLTSFLSVEIELFTLIYALILSAGILLILKREDWPELGYGSMALTYALYLYWMDFSRSESWIGITFLLLYFLITNLPLLRSERRQPFMQLINTTLFAFIFLMQITIDDLETTGIYIFLPAIAIYLFATIAKEKELTAPLYLHLGTVALVVASWIRFDKEYSTLILAAAGIALLIINDLMKKKRIRYTTHLLNLLVGAKLLLYDSYMLEEFSTSDPWQSTRLLSFVAVILLYLVSLWTLRDEDIKEKAYLSIYMWCISAFGTLILLLELEDYWITIGWAILAAIILIVGFLRHDKQERLQGLIIFGLAIIKAFLYDTQELEPEFRIASFIILGLILLAASYLYTKNKDKLKDVF